MENVLQCYAVLPSHAPVLTAIRHRSDIFLMLTQSKGRKEGRIKTIRVHLSSVILRRALKAVMKRVVVSDMCCDVLSYHNQVAGNTNKTVSRAVKGNCVFFP